MKKLNSSKKLAILVVILFIVVVGCDKSEEKKKETSATTIGTSQLQPSAPASGDPSAPKGKQGQQSDIAISVDGSILKKSDLEKQVNEKLNQYKDKIPADKQNEAREGLKKQLMDEFVMRTVLINEIEKRKIEATEKEIKAATDQIKANLPPNKKVEDFLKENNIPKEDIILSIKVKKLVDLELGKNAKPSKKEISKFYNENKDKFSVPESAHVRHILITIDSNDDDKVKAEKKSKIENLRKQVVDGADFADIAAKNSDCPSKEKGGDLGDIKKGQTVKQFEDAAFSQEKNVVGPVVTTEYGYHVMQVLDRTPAKIVTLDDAKNRISPYLEQQKQAEAFSLLTSKLRKQAEIITYEN